MRLGIPSGVHGRRHVDGGVLCVNIVHTQGRDMAIGTDDGRLLWCDGLEGVWSLKTGHDITVFRFLGRSLVSKGRRYYKL